MVKKCALNQACAFFIRVLVGPNDLTVMTVAAQTRHCRAMDGCIGRCMLWSKCLRGKEISRIIRGSLRLAACSRCCQRGRRLPGYGRQPHTIEVHSVKSLPSDRQAHDDR